MKYEDIKVGDVRWQRFNITLSEVLSFMATTRDFNNVHHGKNVYKDFETPVVHGMLTASYIATVIGTKLPGNGALITSHNIKFIQPLKIGSFIEVKSTVAEKRDGQIKIYSDVLHEGKVCVSSTAWVKILEQ